MARIVGTIVHAFLAFVFEQNSTKVRNKTKACYMVYGKLQISKASLESWR